MKIGEALKE
ncbi:Protein of unknown function [Lactobacillus acidophilus DSM 9126]|nr:Protein of unknown function [Lactobacillus acidophilus DSM 20079 = JCM 1132 = NBRC 13951 = CIP 76.13]CDF68565.1 Protein of unknown function [Lactobacillus acidophilus CIRM-BIA 442]CDF72324.1 Protein of unknown function [Lactobacillus acidophilus CIRM-BIA 445]CDF74140.1 Protein of unknown function [Lactobacillus acidophilus DSM 9126]CDF76150.1 Protein of unknown function [Lactobacillus acidophilus DSM 20242]